MTIAQLEKVTLFGPASVKQDLIERLQGLGCLHLEPLRRQAVDSESMVGVSQEARGALKYLKVCPERRTQRLRSDMGPAEIVAAITKVQRRQRDLEEERDALLKAIQTTEPWGDFRVPDAQKLRGMSLWFFRVADGTSLTNWRTSTVCGRKCRDRKASCMLWSAVKKSHMTFPATAFHWILVR